LRRLRDLRAAPLLTEVGPLPAFRGPTPLLQRDAAYRQVYRTWLALHRAPLVTVESPLFDVPIADLPRLYESWCALVVAHAMLGLGPLLEHRLVASATSDDTGSDDLTHTVALVEGAALLCVQRGEATLTLRYQPRYRPRTTSRMPSAPGAAESDGRVNEGTQVAARGSRSFVSLDRHTRVPDLAVEVERPGAAPAVLALDAKYRIEAEGGVPQDALADAYAYLGAIGVGDARATIGAAILFPGHGSPERYPSGVGALPLLPGATEHLAELLADWLRAAVV
jgi:hypothetical protein